MALDNYRTKDLEILFVREYGTERFVITCDVEKQAEGQGPWKKIGCVHSHIRPSKGDKAEQIDLAVGDVLKAVAEFCVSYVFYNVDIVEGIEDQVRTGEWTSEELMDYLTFPVPPE